MLFRLMIVSFFLITSLYSLSTKEELKHTILGYNQLIIDASKRNTISQDFKDLKTFHKFASKKVAQKLYIWIKSWQESALFMDAKLLDINFTKIDIVNKEFAKIETTEKWTYRYINGITKQEAHPDSNITYNMQYQLIKNDDRWVINNITVLSETQQVGKLP